MANPVLTVGGPAVNVPVTGLGGPLSEDPNHFSVGSVSSSTVYYENNVPVPAVGSPYTGTYFKVTNTGSITTVMGNSFPLLNIQALSGAPVATGLFLGQKNLSNPAYANFDVVAGAAVRRRPPVWF